MESLAPGAVINAAPARRPGVVLFALAMGSFAIGTTEFATMSLLPYFSQDLHIDPATAGHVISAYALGVVVGAPTIAVLAARLSRKFLLIMLMLVFGIANGLSALAPDYHWMLFFRFISGVPHGAYFGVASLVGASIVPVEKRAQAVARIMLGLTIATVIGVPAANWMGQVIGWRAGFGLVAVLSALTMGLVWVFAPKQARDLDAHPMRELGALKRGQVWLTLGIGAIGFGGMFAVYTYVASTLLTVTHVTAGFVPVVLCLFGLGMTVGTLFCGWAADKAQMPAIGLCLLWSAFWLGVYPFAAHNVWAISLVVFMIGGGGGLGIMLQTRLMDVAGDAQTMAAALNHSAFNFANALGPLLAGMVIARGAAFNETGYVGVCLALGGFAIWIVSLLDNRRRAGLIK
ncbi:MFS transporter [Asticcacaulis sp.]|uniref:MFS transporter n=1 Tax=Asticcacaulis sp. TaxID=1872648 RepID=UPI002CF3DE26|nr:MFS transporter [Asticcacaulis sp.]HTM80645.1 MFS transporter [Asticcacaulis sp.]